MYLHGHDLVIVSRINIVQSVVCMVPLIVAFTAAPHQHTNIDHVRVVRSYFFEINNSHAYIPTLSYSTRVKDEIK